jgi:cytidylate kinase
MIQVITLSRAHGSGGHEIARRVAESLGWRLVDRALIEEVARLARIPPEEAEAFDERVDPWVVRLARGLWGGSAEAFAGPPQGTVPHADLMADLTRRAVLQAAAAGQCVILGRGAQCILAGRDDTLRVFVTAPTEDRLRRLRPRYRDEAAAAAALVDVDRARNAYVRRYYGCDRTDPGCYDLMINSRLGIEQVVRMILCVAGTGGEAA